MIRSWGSMLQSVNFSLGGGGSSQREVFSRRLTQSGGSCALSGKSNGRNQSVLAITNAE